MLSNKNTWWAFENVLSDKLCDEIVKYSIQQKDQVASIGMHGSDFDKLNNAKKNEVYKFRNSNISWLNETWIHKEICPFIEKANKLAGWNYQYDGTEPMQFTKYNINQYYDWHKDEFDQIYNKNNKYKNKVRKLSVTCALNHGDEYEGGELEFQFRETKNIEYAVCGLSKIKGSVIVFPSYAYHRVKPITKGTRYSLVVWTLGEPWK